MNAANPLMPSRYDNLELFFSNRCRLGLAKTNIAYSKGDKKGGCLMTASLKNYMH